MDNLKEIKDNFLKIDTSLSEFATRSLEAERMVDDIEDYRTPFFRDIDRIIYSLSYTRYIDKTQVYSFKDNDHISKRIIHLGLVNKIARTIGRALGLNTDLIEAIALGHDIGHTPFGHKGEKYLNDICIKENIGYFCHNAQSVRVLKDLEGLNISVQTLDGILAHNGEILINKYRYNKEKKKECFETDLYNALHEEDYSRKIVPMTLEGAVVRLSDIIAYIGRDIEDSIKIGIIKREDIPESITKVLGDNNSKIVDTLIKNIIANSFNKPYLTFSDEVFNGLMELKEWNYKNIYASEEANKHQDIVEKLFHKLYYCYLDKIDRFKTKKEELSQSEKNLYDFIKQNNNINVKRAVVDYIAGQTDQYFINECIENLGGF